MCLLTVIIPNFNHACFLPRCFNAVLAQSWQNFEVVIIDDGSHDNSIEVIESYQDKYPGKIRLFKNGTNQGICFSVNRAIDLSIGKYIAFLSADDVILPGYFESAMDLLKNHPESGGCATFQYFYDEDRPENIREFKNFALKEPSYFSPSSYKEMLKKFNCFIYGAGIVLKKSSVAKCNGYYDLGACSDWLLVFAIALREGLCILPKPFVLIRQSRNSFSSRALSGIAVLPRVLSLLETNFRDVKHAFFESLIILQLGVGIRQIIRYMFTKSYGRLFLRLGIEMYFSLKQRKTRKSSVAFVECENLELIKFTR